MKLGLTEGTLSQTPLSSVEIVETLGRLSVRAFEPFVGTPGGGLLGWPAAKVRQFRGQLHAAGGSIPSTAYGVFNGDSALVTRSAAAQAASMVSEMIDFSHDVGATTMLLCGYLQSAPDTRDKRAALLDVLAAVTPRARQVGVVLALELPLPADELAALVDQADSDHVQVYYDLGNAVALGFDPATEIAHLGSRIRGVHVKDSVNKLGGLHLGRGCLDLDAALAALRQISYDGWLMLETPGDNLDDVARDITILQERWAS